MTHIHLYLCIPLSFRFICYSNLKQKTTKKRCTELKRSTGFSWSPVVCMECCVTWGTMISYDQVRGKGVKCKDGRKQWSVFTPVLLERSRSTKPALGSPVRRTVHPWRCGERTNVSNRPKTLHRLPHCENLVGRRRLMISSHSSSWWKKSSQSPISDHSPYFYAFLLDNELIARHQPGANFFGAPFVLWRRTFAHGHLLGERCHVHRTVGHRLFRLPERVVTSSTLII